MNTPTITTTEARLQTHEKVCAERYDQINARLKRLEGILMQTAGIMLCAMGGIMWTLVYIK